MTNKVREQVSGEQVSREQLSLGSNCHWGASVAGATVTGEQMSREHHSWNPLEYICRHEEID
jgi:hypothetical protein